MALHWRRRGNRLQRVTSVQSLNTLTNDKASNMRQKSISVFIVYGQVWNLFGYFVLVKITRETEVRVEWVKVEENCIKGKFFFKEIIKL